MIEKEISRDHVLELQAARLRWSIAHAYKNSEFYRGKLGRLGIEPGDIRSVDDLKKLPFTDKDELKANYPFGLKAVPEEEIIRIHASSGTTGKRTVAYYTRKDIDDWAEMMARCFRYAGVGPADRVQITVGYGLWTAGVGFQLGVERLGAMAVPVGPVGTEFQLQIMEDFGSTVLVSTSSYGLLLGEEVARRGLVDRIRLRAGVMGSERWGEKMRRRIEGLLGIETFDIIGMTELYGPGTGIDCQAHEGIHYWADHFVFEVVDPVTGEPCDDGQPGELVATTLTREAMPLLRYRTRDITRLLPAKCSCGSPYPMIDRIVGRTDDMFKVRGVNVFPAQIDSVLSGIAGVGSEYQVVLTREGGRDTFTLRVEALPGPVDRERLSARVTEAIKSAVGLTPVVEMCDYGALPRTERKTRRVFDHREE